MDILNQFIEFIQSIVKYIQDLVANIRDWNDKKDN